jgi:hypothetical protein
MKRIVIYSVLGLAALSVSAIASARNYNINQGTVVPIKFEQTIQVQGAKVGQRFTARIDDDRYLPDGLRFGGRITRVTPARRDQPASLTLVFDRMVTPDNRVIPISGVPVVWNPDAFDVNEDGKLSVRKSGNNPNRELIIGGSAIAGALLGELIGRRPLPGAIVGGLTGVVIAESRARDDRRQIVVRSGQRYGLLFNREVRFSL